MVIEAIVAGIVTVLTVLKLGKQNSLFYNLPTDITALQAGELHGSRTSMLLF